MDNAGGCDGDGAGAAGGGADGAGGGGGSEQKVSSADIASSGRNLKRRIGLILAGARAVRNPRQVRKRYPVRNIQATTPTQTTRNRMVIDRLTAKLTSAMS